MRPETNPHHSMCIMKNSRRIHKEQTLFLLLHSFAGRQLPVAVSGDNLRRSPAFVL